MPEIEPELLHRLRTEEEVRIATSPGPGAPERQTTIWVMVDERDRVLVRSVRGERGRWYRHLRANPHCALIFRRGPRSRIEMRAEPAGDHDRVEAANRALHAKYAGIPGFEPMLDPKVLHATLELRPR